MYRLQQIIASAQGIRGRDQGNSIYTYTYTRTHARTHTHTHTLTHTQQIIASAQGVGGRGQGISGSGADTSVVPAGFLSRGRARAATAVQSVV